MPGHRSREVAVGSDGERGSTPMLEHIANVTTGNCRLAAGQRGAGMLQEHEHGIESEGAAETKTESAAWIQLSGPHFVRCARETDFLRQRLGLSTNVLWRPFDLE